MRPRAFSVLPKRRRSVIAAPCSRSSRKVLDNHDETVMRADAARLFERQAGGQLPHLPLRDKLGAECTFALACNICSCLLVVSRTRPALPEPCYEVRYVEVTSMRDRRCA